MSGHTNEGVGREPAVETAEPNTRRIWFYLCMALAFLVIFQIVAYYWFLGMKDAELQAKQVYSEDRNLQLQHGKDAEALERYQWLDKEKGQVQIPVTRAMELLLEEQKAKK